MNHDFRSEIIEYLNRECTRNNIKIDIRAPSDLVCSVFLPKSNFSIVFHEVANPDQIFKYDAKDAYRLSKTKKQVHIWEDQWMFQKEKIHSKLKSLLGITTRYHARETEIKSLDNQQLTSFLFKNHLNVPIKAKYKYGLVNDRNLLAVMSFSKSREMVREGERYTSFELLRFCNRLNITVVGGFSKLLHHFIKSHQPDDIMTYVDADWSDGDYLAKMGFEIVEKGSAMEFWLNVRSGEREYPHLVLDRHNLTSNSFKSNAEKTAFLMRNGYKKVYNSGSYKYILKLK